MSYCRLDSSNDCELLGAISDRWLDTYSAHGLRHIVFLSIKRLGRIGAHQKSDVLMFGQWMEVVLPQ